MKNVRWIKSPSTYHLLSLRLKSTNEINCKWQDSAIDEDLRCNELLNDFDYEVITLLSELALVSKYNYTIYKVNKVWKALNFEKLTTVILFEKSSAQAETCDESQ